MRHNEIWDPNQLDMLFSCNTTRLRSVTAFWHSYPTKFIDIWAKLRRNTDSLS